MSEAPPGKECRSADGSRVRGPGDRPSLEGLVKTLEIITNYLSPLKPSKQTCVTLPLSGVRGLARETVPAGGVCFDAMLKRGFSHIRNAEQLHKGIIYTEAR